MPRKGDRPISGYYLVKFLGRGGFGEVWHAKAPGGTDVALKFINLERKHSYREFRAIQRVKLVRHPNLMSIQAFWVLNAEGEVLDDDALARTPNSDRSTHARLQDPLRPTELILAMPMGDKNLLDRLVECQDQGLPGIPPSELLDYMEDSAKAIDFLNSPRHDLGEGPVALQHCDIKPQNIMIVGNAAQICDFGLLRVLGDQQATQSASGAGGSPAYIAPECVAQFSPSSATDQYSLAVSYIELRTGRLPFAENATFPEVLNAHLDGKLDLSQLSPGEQAVIRRATRPDPRERFASAVELVRKLRSAYEIEATAPPPVALKHLSSASTFRLVRGQKSPLSALTPGLELELAFCVDAGQAPLDMFCFGVDGANCLRDPAYVLGRSRRVSPQGEVQLLEKRTAWTAAFRLDLSRLPPTIRKLVFVATLESQGTMSGLQASHLTIVAGGQLVGRYRFQGSDFGSEKVLVICEIYFKDVWRIAAVGQGYSGGLTALLANYGCHLAPEAILA